jgi:cobalamin biosynthesis protein CobD/CbiB
MFDYIPARLTGFFFESTNNMYRTKSSTYKRITTRLHSLSVYESVTREILTSFLCAVYETI